MKSKIVALSRNEEFVYLLKKKKKVSNKYVSIFFLVNYQTKILKNLIFHFLLKKNSECC